MSSCIADNNQAYCMTGMFLHDVVVFSFTVSAQYCASTFWCCCCCCWTGTWGSWGELGWLRRGEKGGRFGIVKYWMGGGLDWLIRWWWFLAVRHQVVVRRRSTSPIISEPFEDLSLVYRVVLAHMVGGWLWGSHARRVRLSLLHFHILNRWCLLLSLFCVASTWTPGGGHFSVDPSSSALSLTTLIHLCCQAFLHLCHTPGKLCHGRFLPSSGMPDGGLHRVVVVSNILIGCSSFFSLFACHLIPIYLTVAWTPGEGCLVPFIMEGRKEF